ncbi:hypothetical protein C8J56DRAFT_785263, partial [Mycena floridula]
LQRLHNCTVHVTNIQTNNELLLISLTKAKQFKVACDVSVYSLFFCHETRPKSHTASLSFLVSVLTRVYVE